MLKRLRILVSSRILTPSRCCSDFVSRMRYVNRLKQDDAACVAALQTGLFFLFHTLKPLLQPDQQGVLSPAQMSSTDVQDVLQRLGRDRSMVKESVLIGCTEQNQAHFCLDVGELEQAAVEEECEGKFIDLRKAFFLLTGVQAPLVAKGQALLRWHQSSGFCSASGQPTSRNQAGSHRVCSSSGITYYPTMAPVVIVLVSDGKRCLLARQPSFPHGMYSALAGFCDMGESLEEALFRELGEEVGLQVQSFSFSSTQHWPFPQSSFMLGCHAAVNPEHTQLDVDHSELEDARWFNLDEISSALQVQAPPRGGGPTPLWVPPKHAIANRLIREWAEQQRRRQEGEELPPL